MKDGLIGIGCGMVIGVIDVIPMVNQNVTWDANLSAFSMWIIAGFLITKTTFKAHPLVKGISIPMLLLIPNAFIIGWNQPQTLIPIAGTTLALGSILGLILGRIVRKPIR